jgi:hypothetical protein
MTPFGVGMAAVVPSGNVIVVVSIVMLSASPYIIDIVLTSLKCNSNKDIGVPMKNGAVLGGGVGGGLPGGNVGGGGGISQHL